MQLLWLLSLALLHGSCTVTREPTEPAAATEARAGATVSAAASAPRASAPSPYDDLIFDDLIFRRLITGLRQPVFLTHAGDGSGRLFIVEQPGTIRVWQDDALLPDPFLDISDRFREDVAVPEPEQFLLGLAFPPDFARQAHFYVNYAVHTRNGGRHTYVSRFDVDPANPNRGLAASERVLLRIPQPGPIHNGGMLAFGPDRMLWIGLGDGGYGSANAAQDPARLLGKMLRLDVLAGQDGAYRIPPDNPYVGREGVRPEIWALGLRNPWRYSFDRVTGELWIGDVGGLTYEEIHVARTDRSPTHWNFGWPIWEGLHCLQAAQCRRPDLARPRKVFRYTPPQQRVPRVCAIIGGYVYRGRRMPDWRGDYFVGDFCGSIWKLANRGTRYEPAWETKFLANVSVGLSSFGEDEAGELYAVHHAKGLIYRLTSIYGTYAAARVAVGPQILVPSVFDVHLRDRRLILLKAPCADADTAPRFFLHVFPQAAADLPAAQRAAGFENRDFWFEEYGVQRRNACWAIVPLPAYALQRLRLGQATAEGAAALWSEDIVFAQGQAYGTYAGARAAAGPPLARSAFDVHLRDRHLILLKAPCADADTAPRFFLHAVPLATDDLPAAQRAAGFENQDFWFEEYGVQRHNACWAIVPLPAYALQRLRLGQAAAEGAAPLWSEEIVLVQE